MEIGIWGDSITYGQCDTEGLGWVGRLKRSLPTDDRASVYNFGVRGDTSVGLLKRFSVEADSVEPDVVVFAIGINDSKFLKGEKGNQVPIDLFKLNMEELITLAQKHATKIYFVGATKTNDQIVRSSGARFKNETIQIYNTTLKQLAEEKNIPFVDVFDLLDIDEDIVDGVHPNARGYEKMFEVIKSEMIETGI